MLIKKILLGVLILAVAASCKKESTTPGDGSVAASTLLNVSYGSDPLQSMDVHLPAGRSAASTKVILMLHGGAWTLGFGSRADVAIYVDTLKKRFPDYAIFNIDYRLFSLPATNTFPTQELDTKAAVEFIYSKRSEYMISDKFVMVGVSAGAHLSLLQSYKYSSPVKIKAVVDFFGPSDITDLYNNPGVVPASNIALLLGSTPVTNASLYTQSSPLTFATAPAACPTIILQGSNDPLVNPLRQSKALRDKLLTAGVAVEYVEYAGKGHGDDWDNATFFDAFTKIQAFLTVHNP